MGDKKYKVYKYTNKINGKIYIGQTCKTLKARADNGKGYIRCPHFWRAIQKYGWENFEGEILADELTLDEANELEISLIQSLNSTNPSIGYNNRGGGSNGEMTEEAKRKIGEAHRGIGHACSEETKKKVSESLKEYYGTHKHHALGTHYSEERRKLISEAIKGENNPFYGKYHTEEAKKKISEKQKEIWSDKSRREKQSQTIKKIVQGENNPFYGKHHTEEAKHKNSIATRERNLGRHWYNNGKIQVFQYECPDGFVKGMLKKKEVISDEFVA